MKTKTMQCQHGTFTFFEDDKYVGKSLEAYGSYSEDEVSIFQKVLGSGDIAVEVGSNIGALTVPMAQLCKKVYAFEPQPANFSLLVENVFNNGLHNVQTLNFALGSEVGYSHIPYLDALPDKNFGRVKIGEGQHKIQVQTLDNIIDAEDRIKFIKIDVEGHELEVLKGAAETIARDRPVLYIENDRQDKSTDLIGWLCDHSYRCFLHKPPLFYEGNYRKNARNVWGGDTLVSLNMLCVPEEARYRVERLDEIHDSRMDAGMHQREYNRFMDRLSRDPDNLEDRVFAAHYANLNGDARQARALIAENFALDPEHLGTLTTQGLLDLQVGDFAKGWPAYELRYQRHATVGHKFGFRQNDERPHWNGQPTDRVVLIHSEQGFGDSIMFVRFMDEVMHRAPNAILSVQPQLFELFETSKIPCAGLYRQGRTLPRYDLHCSIPSLPATLGLTREDELVRGPYLRADAALVDIWKKRNNPRIGVCLKGGGASERAYSRDMPDAAMEPLRGLRLMDLEANGQWESFADSAAAISSLDLVLSVDTSMAHLAGALGVPTWLMLSSDPDWRWQLGRSDSPWYPSMRIFRQRSFMQWDNVIDEIAVQLERVRAVAA